ncbi:hypothetical protein ACWC10_01765 [Streptomyces sp. NPDC001595]|uniref:hypothetical protein n=1 Tax=Streptomyces sp. NPDC001532 TaxID=3154520 RepID=UPI003323DBF8
MRAKRIGTGTALTVAALAAAGLTFAPTASAVTPQSATFTLACGGFGEGAVTLVAAQSGSTATITLRAAAVTTPIAVPADSISSTLTLARAGGGTVAFSGTENPAMPAGGTVTIGPLKGTVASGDRLTADGGSLRLTLSGFTLTCAASGPQSPGPFVFD